MPARKCSVCDRFQPISTKDWKYASCLPDHFCSCVCLLEWIREQKPNPDAEWGDWAVPNPTYRTSPNFRSDYEAHFSEWLNQNGIGWVYEPFTFAVGAGTYTPDFFLPRQGVFLETKGAWGIGQKKKLVDVTEQYSDLPLAVVPWLLAEEIYNGTQCGCIVR
jgi:hypothetical protein